MDFRLEDDAELSLTAAGSYSGTVTLASTGTRRDMSSLALGKNAITIGDLCSDVTIRDVSRDS